MLFGGGELFTRGVGAGAEIFAVFNTVFLQIQQRFRHLLDVENLSPALVAAAFSSSELGLDVYEQARALAFPTR